MPRLSSKVRQTKIAVGLGLVLYQSFTFWAPGEFLQLSGGSGLDAVSWLYFITLQF